MKQEEKAVEVKDIIKGLTEPIGKPMDSPGHGTVVIVNGGVVTINQAPHLEEMIKFITRLTGKPQAPITHRHRPTRPPTRSNHWPDRFANHHRFRRASPAHRSQQCRRRFPPAGLLVIPQTATPLTRQNWRGCANCRPLAGHSTLNLAYFVPNTNWPGILRLVPQTQAARPFQPFRQLAHLLTSCANCPPPSQNECRAPAGC